MLFGRGSFDKAAVKRLLVRSEAIFRSRKFARRVFVAPWMDGPAGELLRDGGRFLVDAKVGVGWRVYWRFRSGTANATFFSGRSFWPMRALRLV